MAFRNVSEAMWSPNYLSEIGKGHNRKRGRLFTARFFNFYVSATIIRVNDAKHCCIFWKVYTGGPTIFDAISVGITNTKNYVIFQ